MQDFRHEDAVFEEVMNVVSSSHFLSGTEHFESIGITPVGHSYSYNCQLSSVREFLHSISANEEDSAYTALEKMVIQPVARSFYAFNSFAISKYSDAIDRYMHKITDITDKHSKIDLLVHFIKEHDQRAETECLRDRIVIDISKHFFMILQSRILTLRNNYVPAKLMLEAYKVGLYPFGWSRENDTLLCINPCFQSNDR